LIGLPSSVVVAMRTRWCERWVKWNMLKRCVLGQRREQEVRDGRTSLRRRRGLPEWIADPRCKSMIARGVQGEGPVRAHPPMATAHLLCVGLKREAALAPQPSSSSPPLLVR
jgi:hypothetical protein